MRSVTKKKIKYSKWKSWAWLKVWTTGQEQSDRKVQDKKTQQCVSIISVANIEKQQEIFMSGIGREIYVFRQVSS